MTTPNEVGFSLQVRNRIAFTRDMRAAEQSIKSFGNEAERADTKVKASTKSNKDFDSGLSSLTKGLTAGILGVAALRGGMALVKWPAMIVGARVAAGAVSALSAGVVGLTSALTPLAGLLATYPALLAAGAQGLGVFKLATYGIDDALQNVFGTAEEFQESIKGLPPAAQEFARTVRTFEPMFERLRTIAAAGIFPSATELLKGLRPLEGLIARFVRRTSGVLGGLINRVGGITSSAGFATDLRAVMGSNVRILDNLGNAGINLAQAFRDVLVEVQPLTRWLTRLGVTGSEAFKSFIQGQRQSGGLRGFFHETREVTSQILSIAGNLGQVLANVLGAGYGLGRNLLGVLDRLTAQWAEWAGSVGGQNALKQWFDDARPVIMQLGRLVGDIAVGFMEVSRMPGLPGLIRKLRTDLLPVITDIFKTGTGNFGRTLIDLATEAGRLFKVLGTESGPLTAFLRTISTVLRVVNNLIESTGTGGLIASFLALRGVMKGLKFVGMITGFSSLLTMFGGAPGIIAGVGRALTVLFALIMAHPFVAIGGAVVGLVILIVKNWDTIKRVTVRIWQGIFETLRRVWHSIQRVASDAVGGLISFVLRGFRNILSFFITWGQRFLDTAVTAFGWIPGIGPKVRAARDNFKTFTGGLLSDLDKQINRFDAWGDNVSGDLARVGNPLAAVRKQFGDLYDAIQRLPKNVQLQVSTNAGRLASGDAFGMLGGGALGGGSGSRSRMAARAMAVAPGAQVITSGYRPGAITASGNVSFHSDQSNPAQDIGGSSLAGVFTAAERMFGANLEELIYSPMGYSLIDGNRVPAVAVSDHWDHVHLAAKGFAGAVDTPTMFIAGEAGREQVNITPVKTDSSKGRGDGLGAGSVYQRGAIQINSGAIQINGVNDPEKIGKGVLRFIEDRIARS